MGIRTKLSWIFASIILGGLLILTLLLSILTKDYLIDHAIMTLRKEARAVQRILPLLHSNRFHQVLDSLSIVLQEETRNRVTFIAGDGQVIADSDVNSAYLDTVESHYYRPEVQEAREIGWGTAQRVSSTVQEPFLYVAVHSLESVTPVKYVRLAQPLRQVKATVLALRTLVILGGIIMLIITVSTTVVVSNRIVSPVLRMASTARAIARGDYAARTRVIGEDELGKLGLALNQMAETIEADIKQMRKLERMRTEFIGNTSHELKTPIASVKGYIETLLSGGIENQDVNQKFLERALWNVERLQMLVSDLVQISRIESGEMRMSIRYFNIVELLQEMHADFAPQFAEENLKWQLQLPELTDLKVQGDRTRIKQVLSNLITNALKYTHQGKVTLGVVENHAGAMIWVEDSGPGIPSEYHTRIFERFYRLDKDRSGSIGGTGLGLAIVKHILTAHNSSIQVASDGESGTRFWFKLSN